jgi:hypothetical protein
MTKIPKEFWNDMKWGREHRSNYILRLHENNRRDQPEDQRP